MQDSIGLGDEIITAGGIHGTVLELGDEELRIEIATDVVVTLDRRAVAAVATEVEEDLDDEPEGQREEPDEEPLAPGRGPEAS
jgi:preprotein translocase subunit YajC